MKVLRRILRRVSLVPASVRCERRTAVTLFCITVLSASLLSCVSAENNPRNAAIQWDDAALRGARDSKLAIPMASRAFAIAETCMYDAWAAYDDKAVGSQLSGALRRPPNERVVRNKEKAISYAAYRALSDV